jgi:hypothetical protein
MNCETAKNLIQPYLEGRLASLDRNEFVYHVTECGACEAEVIEYREVFRALRVLPHLQPPDRLNVAVMAHLRAEGLVHEPRFPVLRRAVDAFLGLPARVRYPAAALAAVLVLYAPVAVVLAGARGSIAGMAEAIARAVVWMQGAASAVAGLASFDPYARTARTVAHAATELISPGALVLVAIVAAALVYSMSLVMRRKRPSGHAMFSF